MTDKMENGYSLVEILIAILILALISLGVMALLPSGYKQITVAGRNATLNHLGQKKLDYLKGISITHADLTNGNHPVTVEWMNNDSNTKFSTRWTVATYTALPNAKSVIVEVGYDIYTPAGVAKGANEALEQKKIEFRTIITQ